MYQLRILNGQCQVKISDGDWEDISEEEYDELLNGGYEDVEGLSDRDL